MQSVHFGKYSDAQYRFETAFELFYRVNFSEWFSLKPDVQYIAHPGGKGLKNAFAGILRMEIHL